MIDQIQFEVQYSEQEFVRGMMRNYVRADRNWFVLIFSAASFIAGVGLIYWYFREQGPFGIGDVLWGIVVATISIPILIWLHRFRPAVQSQWSKMYKQNPIMQEKFDVTIGSDGITSRSSSFTNSIRWDAFTESFESDDDFFFLLSKQQPLFFPKRAFTAQQMIDVRKLASDKTGSRAKFLH